jgi:hypothetical protein
MNTPLQDGQPANLLVMRSRNGGPANNSTQLGSPVSQLVTPGNGTPMGSYRKRARQIHTRLWVGEQTSSLGSGPGILNGTEVALMESPLPTRLHQCRLKP